ncbi:hypothetical protein H310_05637 [Aphanomyces invadans]|uniref:Uncharacterized protein n=1 Tax=Aphanomyces invadans TaxID=157072 RepID=A0A024UAI8_9STRA|nr:hypothetical protein H310_05637 [Aphanomyces invadans]ETW03240.1 hypothetical protein H310_05637 [Aphanomyces invadans]|eukprot:XP_008868624.1 hypothetical protein H310_05637 [Aphanomyces invadans]
MDTIAEDSDVVGTLGMRPSKVSKANHRRVWSVGVGGAVEYDKLKKEQEVNILHSELEKQSKALEESQEETQLAARIGQTLLLQKQQLDYELEDKLSTLTQRCDTAEAQVRVLEGKYHTATEQWRKLDQLRVQHEVEIEDLANKSIASTSALKSLREELVYTRAKVAEASARNVHLASEVDELKKRVVELKQVNSKLTVDLGTANARLGELRDANQELDGQVTKLNNQLEIALIDATKYEALQTQHASTVEDLHASLAASTTLQDDNRAKCQQIATLGLELQQAAERLELERTMAQELLRKHDMHTAASGHSRAASDFNLSTTTNGSTSVPGLKHRSLFHELSLQLIHDVGPLQQQVVALKDALANASTNHSAMLATMQSEMQTVASSREEALAKAAEMKGQLATASQAAQEWEQKCIMQTREVDLVHRQLEHAAIELADALKCNHDLRDKLAKAEVDHGLALQQHSRDIRSLQAKYQHLQDQYAQRVAKSKAFVAHTPGDGTCESAGHGGEDVEPKYHALVASFQALQANHDDVVEQLEASTSRMHAAEAKVDEQAHQLATQIEDLHQLQQLWSESKVTVDALRQRNEELSTKLYQTSSPTKQQTAMEIHRQSLLERGSLFHELSAHVEHEVEMATASTAIDLASEQEQMRAMYEAEQAKPGKVQAANPAAVALYHMRAKYQRKADRVVELEALLAYTSTRKHSIYCRGPANAAVFARKGTFRDFPWDLQLKPIPVVAIADMHAIAGTHRPAKQHGLDGAVPIANHCGEKPGGPTSELALQP